MSSPHPRSKDPSESLGSEFFESLVRQYQGLVYQYVFQMVRDFHLTQDLSQEVFLKVYRNLSRYDSRYLLSTWLLRIAHNHTVDYLRKKRVETVSMEQPAPATGAPLLESLPDQGPFPSEIVARRQRRRWIQETIYSMPLEARGILVLRYLEGKKLEEIAYILDLPLGTVKSRINRARSTLQRRLRNRMKG